MRRRCFECLRTSLLFFTGLVLALRLGFEARLPLLHALACRYFDEDAVLPFALLGGASLTLWLGAAMALQHPDRPDVHTLVARLLRKDGSYVWVEMVTRASTDDDSGEVVEVMMSTRDLTAYVGEDGFPELRGRVAPALASAT